MTLVLDPDCQLQKIKTLHPGAIQFMESGIPFVFLPSFTFHVAEQEQTMDLLLCPAAHTNYPTRLFFHSQIPGKGANWNQFYIAGKQWWAHSWQGVEANIPWLKILYAHLEAVK